MLNSGELFVLAYALLLLICVYAVVPQRRFQATSLLFAIITIGVTWYYIASFFFQELAQYNCSNNVSWNPMQCDDPKFQASPSLFIKAYVIVSNTAVKWVWSSQLLMFALTFSVWVDQLIDTGVLSAGEGVAYLGLGFMGAISFALSLLLGNSAVVRGNFNIKAKLSVVTVVCTLIGMICFFLLPLYANLNSISSVFAVSLILCHVILAVPALLQLFKKKIASKSIGNATTYFYLILAGCSFLAHVYNIVQARRMNGEDSLLYLLYTTLWDNYCQTSISLDLVFSSILTCIWMIQTRKKLGILLAFMTPLISISTTFPMFLALNSVKQKHQVKLN